MNQSQEPLYAEGTLVAARVNPEEPLKIRRYVDRIYYCRHVNAPEGPDAVFFERELQKFNA